MAIMPEVKVYKDTEGNPRFVGIVTWAPANHAADPERRFLWQLVDTMESEVVTWGVRKNRGAAFNSIRKAMKRRMDKCSTLTMRRANSG